MILFPLLTFVTSLYLFISIINFAHQLPPYRHLRDTISELGETGSAFEKQVGYGVFLPVGLILILAGAILYFAAPQNDLLKNLCGLMACVGVGYAVAAFFPCDPGSPVFGTTRQQIHNLGGFIESAGGAFFLFKASETIPVLSKICFTVVVCMIAISITTFWRGLIQRVAEIALFGAIVYLSLLLVTM
jgi:hypothetical protein